MNIIIFIVILLVLVLVHEFGHFFTAKSFGIRVDEFGFGFPPKLFGVKKGETEYTFNAIPFGGFVKIFGENPDEESINGVDKERSFVNKPRWKQAIVLSAGIFSNFLLAWVLFSICFMLGLPISASNQTKGYQLQDVNLVIVSVQKESLADIAGIKSGDKIVKVTSKNDSLLEINPDSFKSFVLSHGNKEIEIGYLRGQNKDIETVKITPTSLIEGEKPTIGIAMDQIGTAKLPFFKALWEGLRFDWNVTKSTVVGLYNLIKGGLQGDGSFSSVTGPVGMVGIVGNAYEFGFVYLLYFAALISVNLAVINLIPFPALDGGRLFFLLIEKIKGSRINTKIANTANMVGFSILIILMILVTYHDIINLF